MDRKTAMLKVVEDVVADGRDLIPGWRLLENAKKAAERGGPEELRRYYERCLRSKDSRAKHVTGLLHQHGRKTLESEYSRFMAAYHTDLKSGAAGLPPSPATGSTMGTMSLDVSPDDLARYRRCLDRLLDQIEPPRSQDEKLVPRIRRLGRTRRIPRKIEPLMLTVAEIRNASEHDRNPPSRQERLVAKNAWEAIIEWARKKGLTIPDSSRTTSI